MLLLPRQRRQFTQLGERRSQPLAAQWYPQVFCILIRLFS